MIYSIKTMYHLEAICGNWKFNLIPLEIVNKKKKFGVGGTDRFSYVKKSKWIIADSPLQDISGCRRPKSFLDILAVFHVSFILIYKVSFGFS